MENFWCAARLQPRREALATHCLGLAGYEVYLPRLRKHRRTRGRSVEHRPPLFPGYIFILIVLQWSAARYSPGVATLVMNGGGPARVPDGVIDEIRSRERGGLIELPKPRGLRRGIRSESSRVLSRITWLSMTAWPATSAWRSCCGFWVPSSAPSFPPLPWRPCDDPARRGVRVFLLRHGPARARPPRQSSSSGSRISWTPTRRSVSQGRATSTAPSGGAGRSVDSPASRRSRGVRRWDQAEPRFERVSKRAV